MDIKKVAEMIRKAGLEMNNESVQESDLTLEQREQLRDASTIVINAFLDLQKVLNQTLPCEDKGQQ